MTTLERKTRRNAGAPADEPLLGTVTQIAATIDLHRSTVSKLIRERGIEPAGKRLGRAVYLVRDVLRAARKLSSGAPDLDALSPYERDAMSRTLMREMEMRRRRGELIELYEHERTLGLLAMFVARAFETAVDNLERDVGLSPRQAEYLERHFDQQREALAMQWSADHEQQPKVNGHDETYEARV